MCKSGNCSCRSLLRLARGGSWLFPAEAQTRVQLPTSICTCCVCCLGTSTQSVPSKMERSAVLGRLSCVDEGTGQVQISGFCSPFLGPFPIIINSRSLKPAFLTDRFLGFPLDMTVPTLPLRRDAQLCLDLPSQSLELQSFILDDWKF